MVYRSELDGYTQDVERARVALAKAMQEHSAGSGSLEKVNKARSELANAHFRWRECSGLNVPDRR
jgi:hypothetical protein